MSREAKAARRARVAEVIRRLCAAYPDAHCELEYANPLELLVATILSAQCTDKQVNRVTADLFKKYRRAADYARAPLAELEQDIRSLGFFRNKARSLQRCCQRLVERHGGRVPESMAELTQLEGVGRKTANVVLGNAFGRDEGIVVDTHVSRLAQRLGLTRQSLPEKIEQELLLLVPRELWTLFSHWLIWHGRRRCAARKPDCPNCELRPLCPTARTALAPGARATASRRPRARPVRRASTQAPP
jgi:endonuclease-3